MPELETGCNKFGQFLLNRTPYYDQDILQEMKPNDSFLGMVETGTWPSFTLTTHTKDRFRGVFPDVSQAWDSVSGESCVGTPCDPREHEIGYGWDRSTYSLLQTSYKTPLICFDQIATVTQAKEHYQMILRDILRPATNAIMGHFIRKQASKLAGQKWAATAGMTDTTLTWSNDANGREVYMDSSVIPTSLLTPQMLQRRYQFQLMSGALGKDPFKDDPGMLKLVTDVDTLWNLEHVTTDTYLKALFRYEQWGPAQEYYKYGYSGQIGNYAVKADPMPLRFQRIGANRFQLVTPFHNVTATTGIKSAVTTEYLDAPWQLSFIWSRQAMRALVFNLEQVNPEMPFLVRDLAGRWQFVMDNLGADANGCVIENKRRNKGQFLADFKVGMEPMYVEFMEAIFHQRSQPCVNIAASCASDWYPAYYTESYDSKNTPCTFSLDFTPVDNGRGTYVIAANTITCGGVPMVHEQVSGASLFLLAARLNILLPALGTWDSTATTLTLSNTTCEDVGITWVTT